VYHLAGNNYNIGTGAGGAMFWGGGAQGPVLPVYEPKKADARGGGRGWALRAEILIAHFCSQYSVSVGSSGF